MFLSICSVDSNSQQVASETSSHFLDAHDEASHLTFRSITETLPRYTNGTTTSDVKESTKRTSPHDAISCHGQQNMRTAPGPTTFCTKNDMQLQDR